MDAWPPEPGTATGGKTARRDGVVGERPDVVAVTWWTVHLPLLVNETF